MSERFHAGRATFAIASLSLLAALGACGARAPRTEASATATPPASAASAEVAEGRWSGQMIVAAVDPAPGSGLPGRTVFTLVREKGSAIELEIPDSVLRDAGGVAAVNGKQVVVTGVENTSPRVVRVRSIVLSS